MSALSVIDSPFHEGELQIQEKLGVHGKMDRFGRKVIRDFMPDQHRKFYSELPFIFLSHIDSDGYSWASLITANPGFISSPDEKHLNIECLPLSHDPLNRSLKQSLPVGVLGIDLSNRRRNRLSAEVEKLSDSGFSLKVRQSFGNCPKFITVRNIQYKNDRGTSSYQKIDHLNREAQYLIMTSDTFFVSSDYTRNDGSQSDGGDVSHRGGPQGFVRVDNEKTLTIPDYSGNFHFNTLGNFLMNPAAGLLFIDFESGDLMSLTGHAEIDFGSPDQNEFPDAQRLWKFNLDHGFYIKNAIPFTWAKS